MKCCIPAMPSPRPGPETATTMRSMGRKTSLVDPGVDFLLREFRIGQQAGIPKVEIDDDVFFCRHFRKGRAHRVYGFFKPIIFSMGREDVTAFSCTYSAETEQCPLTGIARKFVSACPR